MSTPLLAVLNTEPDEFLNDNVHKALITLDELATLREAIDADQYHAMEIVDRLIDEVEDQLIYYTPHKEKLDD